MTLEPSVRKFVTYVEETLQERGEVLEAPPKKGWAAAVVHGADKRINQSESLALLGEQLGQQLGALVLEKLGRPEGVPLAYGKSAIVGSSCEIEQGAAILHPKLGKSLRALIGQGSSLIPSTIKRGGPGQRIDVPLHGADDEWDLAMLDSIEAMVPDAPNDNEVVVVVALAYGSRAGAVIAT